MVTKVRKQIQDFASTGALVTNDYFLFQRLDPTSPPTTLRVSFKVMADSMYPLIETMLKGMSNNEISPQLTIIGKTGRVHTNDLMSNDQLVISNRGNYSSINIISQVNHQSRIVFSHDDNLHHAMIYHAGISYSPDTLEEKIPGSLVFDVGTENHYNRTIIDRNKTTMNKLLMIEKEILSLKSGFLCDPIDEQYTLKPELVCCIKDVTEVHINDPHTEIDLYSSMVGESRILFKHFGAGNAGAIISGGPDNVMYNELLAIELRMYDTDCTFDTLNGIKISANRTDIIKQTYINDRLNVLGINEYEGGKVNVMSIGPRNPLSVKGIMDIVLRDDIGFDVWSTRFGMNGMSEDPYSWIAWMELDNTGSFYFKYGEISDESQGVCGWAETLSSTSTLEEKPKFVIKKLIGGGPVVADRTGNLYIEPSDVRLKENITTMQEGLSVIQQLRPVEFTWKPNPFFTAHGRKNCGLIAQEVQSILPDMINSDGSYYTIDHQQLIPILIRAVQELNDKIIQLEKNQNLE